MGHALARRGVNPPVGGHRRGIKISPQPLAIPFFAGARIDTRRHRLVRQEKYLVPHRQRRRNGRCVLRHRPDELRLTGSAAPHRLQYRLHETRAEDDQTMSLHRPRTQGKAEFPVRPAPQLLTRRRIVAVDPVRPVAEKHRTPVALQHDRRRITFLQLRVFVQRARSLRLPRQLPGRRFQGDHPLGVAAVRMKNHLVAPDDRRAARSVLVHEPDFLVAPDD